MAGTSKARTYKEWEQLLDGELGKPFVFKQNKTVCNAEEKFTSVWNY
jgi:hypothetical protein